MELVYLWVEKYKNIENQGFNFSPKFDCTFNDDYEKDANGDEKLKYNCKLDINPKNHIENFFGENINITAIVGKNGSGKSSLLQLLESGRELRNINSFFVYKKDENYYCQFKHTKPKIVFNEEINYIDSDDISNESSFYPKVIRIAHSEKIGEDELSHYYFGSYSGLYGGIHIDRQNDYNMLEARFFVPRYINITTDHIELFEQLKQMYKFDILRLLLRNNSTSYVRKWINNERDEFEHGITRSTLFPNLVKVCIYEKTEQILNNIQKKLHRPIREIEIHLYNKNREKIVSVLENIENIHRNQSYTNQIKKFNKFHEFDLAVLIGFAEYYLKNTDPCDPSDLIYEALLEIQDTINNNVIIDEHIFRLRQSYILNFFQKLKDKDFKFLKDDVLTIDQIVESIHYVQQLKINYFDYDGSPYIDIPIDTTLKENLDHIRIMQKIFFDYEFDCGNEKYLRVFEYDLINSKIGSSYETISDGEKHFIRFSIDIIYYLETLKKYNFTPEKESLALFLADEPDNAMHPIWKKRLINSVLEILNNYSNIPNIKQHFIFTTHSPFLLSDLPKQNIIFLDTYDNGKCKVLKHDQVIKKKQTFGANIHTLLSDSFFMEDGLMGEFAKGKIDQIKDFYDQNKDLKQENSNFQTKKQEFENKKRDFYHIQSIIGEPFLQTIMKNYLDELEILFYGKKEFLTKEITRLQQLQKSLQ